MTGSISIAPPRCNVKVDWDGDTYAAEIDPGYPGCTSGPPDNWEPPEPGNIVTLYKWDLVSFFTPDWNQMPDDWDIPSSLQDALWEKFNSDGSIGETDLF